MLPTLFVICVHAIPEPLFSCFSFVDEVARSRDPEKYSLSIELVSSTTSTILALKVAMIFTTTLHEVACNAHANSMM